MFMLTVTFIIPLYSVTSLIGELSWS